MTLFISYLAVTCYFFIKLLTIVSCKSIESTENSFLSVIVLLLVTTFCPVILPIFGLASFNNHLLILLKR